MTTEHLRHIGYDELGQRVRVVAGNGVETKCHYNESTRRLCAGDTYQEPGARAAAVHAGHHVPMNAATS